MASSNSSASPGPPAPPSPLASLLELSQDPEETLAGHAAVVVGSLVVAHALRRLSVTTLENMWLDATYVRFFCSFLHMVAAGSMLVGGCQAMGVNVDSFWGTLITSGSVVFGLASQDVLSNFTAGLLLMMTRPIEVGDVVSVAGSTGAVASVDFFQTTIVTANNEGIVIPNSDVVGGALQNFSSNYRSGVAPGLREVDIDLVISPRADLEDGIQVLEGASLMIDEFIASPKCNGCGDKKDFPNGSHTLREYHRIKYGEDLLETQKSNPTLVFVGGLHDSSGGHAIQVRAYCDNTLYWDVFQFGYRECIKALRKGNIETYDASCRRSS